MEKTEIKVEINPKGFESEYLKCLNICFGHWGNHRAYTWAFERSVGALKTDLMVLRKGGKLLAGSAVNYRKIMLSDGKTIDVGIMTGSWTLPEARGQKCFSRIIQESVQLAAKQNCALLLAFVTEENASYRRLAEAGSALFPTYYMVSTPETPKPNYSLPINLVSDPNILIEKIMRNLESAQKNKSHFVYSSSGDWSSQFLKRPENTEFLAIADDAWCVIEKGETTDRLELLVLDPNSCLIFRDCLNSLLQRAMDNGRQLFLFTSLSAMHQELQQLRLRTIPGHLTALAANTTELKNALGAEDSWNFSDSKVLADSNSQWFLGEWDICSGDRM